jgi:hypothetical protein
MYTTGTVAALAALTPASGNAKAPPAIAIAASLFALMEIVPLSAQEELLPAHWPHSMRSLTRSVIAGFSAHRKLQD